MLSLSGDLDSFNPFSLYRLRVSMLSSAHFLFGPFYLWSIFLFLQLVAHIPSTGSVWPRFLQPATSDYQHTTVVSCLRLFVQSTAATTTGLLVSAVVLEWRFLSGLLMRGWFFSGAFHLPSGEGGGSYSLAILGW